jgi:hypothetical protein
LTLLLLLLLLLQGGPSPQTSPCGSNSGPTARPAAGRSTAVRSSAAGKPPAGAGKASKPAAAGSAGGGGGGAAAAGDDGAVDESALSGGLLNAHEAKSRLSELLGEEMITALADAQWKVGAYAWACCCSISNSNQQHMMVQLARNQELCLLLRVLVLLRIAGAESAAPMPTSHVF